MRHINWGIISTGTITRSFMETVTEMNKKGENIKVCGVASRNFGSASDFAERYGIAKAYGSYEQLAADEDIDVIYIGTPHNLHYENMMMCLNSGKHVLCEKAFTVTAKEAREVYALAKKKNLFVMEAFWTKFIPVYRQLEKIIADGTIGDVNVVTAQYGYCTGRSKRKFDPDLAGGALLDIGVYTIGFAAMILGYYPNRIQTSVSINSEGTDSYSGILLEYENAKIAQLTTAVQTTIPTHGCIYGSLGYISVKDFKNPESFEIFLNDGYYLKVEEAFDVNGFEYEIRETESCIASGKCYSDIMTPEQSIAIMDIMDNIRDKWQMRFPFE